MKKLYMIALCDDEARELDQIEAFLAGYQEKRKGMKCQIRRFSSAEMLLEQIRERGYAPHLLLLDIFMPGKSGIEAAEELRKLGFGIPIIFLTTSTEHALNAYGVDAIQYLVKPLGQERFFHAMDTAVEQIGRRKENQITIKVPGGIRQVQPDEILYCETQRNYQVLHLPAEECRTRMTAGKLWELLEQFPQFGRCGSSYILNMNHIVSLERDEIALDNGSRIYIPRYKAAEFRKGYFSYYFDASI